MYTVDASTTVNAKSVEEAILYNEAQSIKFKDLKNYYLGNQPILQRTKPNETLANVKMMVNHARYITDMNVGYLLGNEIEYSYEGKSDTTVLEPVLDMYKRQPISDIDVKLGKKVSIAGKGFEYVYANANNEVKSKDIAPENCIVAYDDSMEHEALFAVIYSSIRKISETKNEYNDVLVLTKRNIIKYNKDLEIVEINEHYHEDVPVVEYWNNDDAIGDFETVVSLIDAYNILQSDRVNDKQQLVEALLVLYGVSLTEEQLRKLKINRVMTVDKEARAEYLTKVLNEADTDVLRKVIEADICKISMTPNFTDENFAGNSTGVALKLKLLPFEQNALIKEKAFRKGLLKRFELYNNYLVKGSKSSMLNTYDIGVIFKRNLPQNDLETSQMITNLDGKVSTPTLISQLSFVENADDEVKWTEEEKAKNMNLENQQFGTDVASVGTAQDITKQDTQTKKQSLVERMRSLVK
jgi:SPP1 family phage portal protein